MEKEIEKLKLHIVRLEQCIRQVQRMQALGLLAEGSEERIDGYLDAIILAKKKIKELETRNKEGA